MFISERALQRAPNLRLLLQPIQVLFKPFLFGHTLKGLTDDEALITRPGCGERLQEPRRLFVDCYLHFSHTSNPLSA